MPKKTSKKTSTAKKVNNAFVISQYYGFDAIDIPNVDKEDREAGESLKKGSNFIHDVLPPVEEHISLLRSHRDEFKKEEPSASMIYCEGQARGSHKKKKLKPGEKVISLHVIGTPKSIAEAVLIKTALCILEEEGFKDISVEINNVGGKESMITFFKELTSYYKKQLGNMNAECRQVFKDGTHSLISCKDQIDAEILENAPSPLNFLTDANRNHLKEVVEYLDSQDIPYEINKDILGDPHYSTDTIFTIVDKKNGKVLATGSRYNQISKKAGIKVEVPSVGITLKLKSPKQVPGSKVPNKEKIRFFFIQIGFTAKLKSLQVIEKLRKEKIPVHLSLSNDRLSKQLQKAKKLDVDYILLMGQQEAIDNTIVVRDTKTHKQEPVPINKLPAYLKKLK